jgi:alkylation response protein AidB-like acyl-CoA dehydrogenase
VGGRPLVEQQALRHRLADALTRLLATECLLAFVLDSYEAGRPLERELAALKLQAAATGHHVIDECLQILGGRGYTANFPLERLWRDARLARIGGGTDEVMREVLAQKLDRPDHEVDELLDRIDALDDPSPLTPADEE